MSQILDALKRSEAARPMAPDVPVAVSPVWRASPRRSLWPLWVGLAVAGVLAAGAWQNRRELWPDRFSPVAEVTPAATEPKPATASDPAPDAPVVAVPPPAVPPPTPAETIQPDPAAPASINELAPTTTIIQPADVAVPNGTSLPGQRVTGLTPMTAQDTMPIPAEVPQAPVQAPEIQSAPAAMAAAPTLPVYTDLPYSLRRDLPVLRFSTYRYHDDPGQRFVVYQERRISEQGVLGQELWLREIHPDHLVLDFRGTLFTVPR